MRELWLGCGVAVVVLGAGCGDGAARPPVDGDAGSVRGDGAAGGDSGGTGADAGPAADSGPPVDAALTPEVCTGGLDEDGDVQTDCDDSDCWTFDACVAADVARTVPGLVACGDAIELDAMQTAAACATIGTPSGSTYPTECAAATMEATGRVFCDASGAAAALWIEERLAAPRSMRMLSARRFELTSFERAAVLDWEQQVSGASTRGGTAGYPIHEAQDHGGADTTAFRVITVRAVMPSDAITRLLGMSQITSIIDLDLPMSMDTRRALRTGGLAMAVPAG